MEFRERVRRAVGDRGSLDGMRKSFHTIEQRQRENACRIPDLEARKQRLRRVKESSVGDDVLVAEAMATLRANGFRVLLAKSAEAAVKVIADEVKGNALVVKSKSNVTKELHLADRLAEQGVEVVETDLGDRIVQLAKCQAAHPTGPACHLTRGQIAKLFTSHFGREVSEDPSELTSVMRDEIADYIARAKVGITGANAIAAREGAVVIVHNEGNAAKCAMVPGKHIIVTTPEKVVPDLDEAINVTKLQTYLSTGKIISSYINIITGQSYTADIEKKVYKGMHGPKEVVVVLVDDGRIGAEDREAMYCIGCGMCLLRCPVYNAVGPVFGSDGHMGGIGVYLAGSTGKIDEASDAGSYLCTSCGACKEVCPALIDTKKGIMNVRKSGYADKKGILPEHSAVLSSVRNYDNPWQVPRAKKGAWAKGLNLREEGEVLYFVGCSTSLLFPDTARAAVAIIRSVGAEPAVLGQKERCCGSTVHKLGDVSLAREKAEGCFADFKKAGARVVVTSCPGCASALNRHKDLVDGSGIKVQHISQFLSERMDLSTLEGASPEGPFTFHDPCDLGRELGVYEEPRRLLAAAAGGNVVEMERCRAESACCGSGSGVRSAFPELASSIASDRVSMAKAAGARSIVTSCPWCVQSLRECQGDEGAVEVVDLVDLLARSVKK
ncbi:MAG: LUD domain-containing protein [Thermoplasmata archaeon]|nr:LUD domain-containing protein [Thermoplasmata archaeon]